MAQPESEVSSYESSVRCWYVFVSVFVKYYTIPFYLHDWFGGLQLLYYLASKSVWSNLKSLAIPV